MRYVIVAQRDSLAIHIMSMDSVKVAIVTLKESFLMSAMSSLVSVIVSKA